MVVSVRMIGMTLDRTDTMRCCRLYSNSSDSCLSASRTGSDIPPVSTPPPVFLSFGIPPANSPPSWGALSTAAEASRVP